MMRDEAQYNCESVHITLQAVFLIDSNDDYQKKLDAARLVEVFRKKHHELAWTFLNTMNNVHHCHTLHNNMSLDNVMLHFLPNSVDKVYIDICDWAMARNFNDLKESLHIHESQEARTRIMEHKWWIALEWNYVLPPLRSTRDVDFKEQPKFALKNETYVVGKIAEWIYGGNLFIEYYSKQYNEERGDDTFSFSTMDQVFQRSLEQLYKDNVEQRATLNRIVNRFMSIPFNWPVYNVGDTL